MMNEDCWLKDKCNHVDCDKFCIRKYKLDFLYNNALISYSQRQHINLIVDSDGSDIAAFTNLKTIEQNIESFVNTGDSLFIYSNQCGNGKTSWALRLVQSYFNKIWYKTSLNCKALFINVPRFLLELKTNISEKSEYIQHIKDNALSCDIIIWDEIGSKGLSQFEHEQLLSIINARIDNNKSNIYTSNLNLNDLHEALGDRLYSRIINLSTNIELKGADKRRLSKEDNH